MDLEALLNQSQQQAVEYCQGPELVIAGAGSGKTRVLTYKIAYLIELGVEPDSILALTFTNKAAAEMRSRIASVVGSTLAKQLWMGTFHSVFLRILRRHASKLGFNSEFSIYDNDDSISLINKIIKEFGLDTKECKPSAVYRAISLLKNHGLLSKDYTDRDWDTFFGKFSSPPLMFGEIYKEYDKRMRQFQAMDFDDILLNMLSLLENKKMYDRIESQFNYILVDEYQDTNSVQHQIVSLLARKHRRLCVVGDDAQSIYSFRGASIGNILEFRRAFPETEIFKLEQNYRSTQMIVQAANSLIKKNSGQIPKDVYSKREVGDPLTLYCADDDRSEGAYVAMNSVKLVKNFQADYKDIVILYRNNSQSRSIEDAFRRLNIPYIIVAGISFYQRAEIKDILAYLRFMINPYDLTSLSRIINYPTRGIGATTQKLLMDCFFAHPLTSPVTIMAEPKIYGLELKAKALASVKAFGSMMSDLIETAKTQPVNVAVHKMFSLTKMEQCYNIEGDEEERSKAQNVREFLAAVDDYLKDHMADQAIMLSDFLAEVALITDMDMKNKNNSNAVSLMTIHAAKGLEFDYVFVVGLENGLFPTSRSMATLASLEEERRLLYVAITRAKERCFLSCAKYRYRNGRGETPQPSQFIEEIDTKYLKLPANYAAKNKSISFEDSYNDYLSGAQQRAYYEQQEQENQSQDTENEYGIYAGDKVMHMVFGQGVVQQIFDSGANCKASVLFERVGEKMLLLKYARLKKL